MSIAGPRLETTWILGPGLDRWLLALVLLALLALNAMEAWGPAPVNSSPREAQTASTARDFHHRGISLLAPRLDLWPDPNYLLLEVPIYQALVALEARRFGHLEMCGKLTSALFFLGALVYLYLLVLRYTGNRRAAMLAAVLFGTSPLCVTWRAVLAPDHMALFLAMATLYHAVLWSEGERPLHFGMWAASGLLAVLIKPYCLLTVTPLLLASLWAQASGARPQFPARRLLAPVGIMLLWAACLALWVAHSAHLNRVSGILGQWLSGTSLLSQQLGSLRARLSVSPYRTTFLHLKGALQLPLPYTGFFALVGLAILSPVKQSRVRKLVGLWALGDLLAVGTFFSVATYHNYYKIPLLPPLAILVALALDRLLAATPDPAAGPRPRPSLLRWVWVLPALLAAAGTIVSLAHTLPPLSPDRPLSFGHYVILGRCLLAGFAGGALVLVAWQATRGGSYVRGGLALALVLLFLYGARMSCGRAKPWLLETASWIHAHSEQGRPVAVVSWRGPYFPELLYCAARPGYTLGFPNAAPCPGCARGAWPYRMDAGCIDWMRRHGVRDLFIVLLDPAREPPPGKLARSAAALGLKLAGHLGPLDAGEREEVWQYRIPE